MRDTGIIKGIMELSAELACDKYNTKQLIEIASKGKVKKLGEEQKLYMFRN